jgi:hypothetical protein
VLAIDRAQNVRIGLTVNTVSVPLSKTLPGAVPDDFAVAINVASVTRAPCEQDTQCSGLWPQDKNEWSSLNVVSVSCSLYPCVQQMKAEVIRGQFLETDVHKTIHPVPPYEAVVDPNTRVRPVPSSFFAPCWENNTRYDYQPTNLTITEDREGHVIQLPPCAFAVSGPFTARVTKFVK